MTTAASFDKKVAKIEWIPVKQLCVIWVQAQRPLDEKRAQEIADNFDPEMFGTISVTKPNGEGIYHTIDGQTRRRAVEILYGSAERVPCEIYNVTDPARAAHMFDKINSNRRLPQMLDFFRVRVTAGDEDEVTVDKIVKANGMRVGPKADGAVACVSAMLFVYRSFGGDTLDSTFKILQATWGKQDQHAFEAPFVRGYGEFLSEYRKANWQRLSEKIAKRYSPGAFIGAAKMGRDVEGGSIASNIKRILLATYNRGLPPSQQLKSVSRATHDGDSQAA
jgi:Family of unknown function (DUF6551)